LSSIFILKFSSWKWNQFNTKLIFSNLKQGRGLLSMSTIFDIFVMINLYFSLFQEIVHWGSISKIVYIFQGRYTISLVELTLSSFLFWSIISLYFELNIL
jgi:hypothetical protein